MTNYATDSLSGKVVTVLGGSGFFGTHLAQELLARGARLKIASRNPQRAHQVKPLANLGQVSFARCDITRPETVLPVLAGSDAVVNLVGAFDGNLDAVQGEGIGEIARLALGAGAKDFVHISAIGADANSSADYARTKAQGEMAVREAFPDATILRPSILFGSDDEFVMMFAGLIATFPVLPVFAPHAKLQPVFVDDAADAVAAVLSQPGTARGKTFELGGPEVLTMLELNQKIARAQGRNRHFIELPDQVSKTIAFLPGTPISTDQLTLLQKGNIATGQCPGFEELGIAPRPLSLYLDRWMVRFRKHGRFARDLPAA